jgi:hypothetical protein
MMNQCAPVNCMCFCPSAEVPVPPIAVVIAGPGVVATVTLFGTLGFTVGILTNPAFAVSLLPAIASVALFSGNILQITTAAPIAGDAGNYDAVVQVSNGCGSIDIPIRVVVS